MALAHKLHFSDNAGLMTVSSEDQRVTELSIHNILKHYSRGEVAEEDLRDRRKIELTRELHHLFIQWFLTNDLPGNYVGLDASRPWQMYWCTHALYGLLGQECPRSAKQNIIKTLGCCRPASSNNKYGRAGFGGGPGQIMHLAPTYAAVMTLASISASKEDWESLIDRQAYKNWLLSLKQPDGSFVMHENGEVDVRALYCALSTAALLNVLTPELTEKSAQYIANCQTYEGGFSGASFSTNPANNPPMAEAHGGYSFCALATYFLLCPPSSAPVNGGKPSIDVEALARWSAHMQGLPIEAGGFRGRTNKLVDGCYSWWNGGLFQFIEAYLPNYEDSAALYNREALQEYILLIGQAKAGGLQDKPGKANDTYHTCYCLSGLSAAQNRVKFSRKRIENFETSSKGQRQSSAAIIKDDSESEADAVARQARIEAVLRSWVTSLEEVITVGLPENLVKAVHPIFGLEMGKANAALDIFY